MLSKLSLQIKKNITDKSFWLSNLKTLAIMLVIVFAVTQYQQRNMTTGEAPKLTEVSYNDKPTLVYFWGSWCSICQTTSPAVSTLAQESLDDNSNYQIISVALSSGDDEEVQQYQQQHDYQFKTLNDDNGQISKHWGVAVTPSFFIINKDGKITTTSSGMTSLWGMKVRLWLASF